MTPASHTGAGVGGLAPLFSAAPWIASEKAAENGPRALGPATQVGDPDPTLVAIWTGNQRWKVSLTLCL